LYGAASPALSLPSGSIRSMTPAGIAATSSSVLLPSLPDAIFQREKFFQEDKLIKNFQLVPGMA
jgi:hypothetical protein